MVSVNSSRFFTGYLRRHDLTHPRGLPYRYTGVGCTFAGHSRRTALPTKKKLSQTQPERYGAQSELELMTCVKTNKDENVHGQSTTHTASDTLRSFNSRFEYTSTDLIHTELWWQCYPGGTIVWARTFLKVPEWAVGKLISAAHRVQQVLDFIMINQISGSDLKD